MATQWICEELDVESYDSIDTKAERGLGDQNRLAMVFEQNMASLLP